MKNILILACLLCAITTIGEYDFNACRISNCNAEEINCISDEATCFNSYTTLRVWYFLHNSAWQRALTPRTGTPAGQAARTLQPGATPST